jgi:3'-5' exoribonuclease
MSEFPRLSELQPNDEVLTTLLVHAKEIRQKKTGEPYLSLTLGDRTGEIDAKMWDNVTEVMNAFERDDFIKVKGRLQVYNKRLQLTIHKLRRLEESEVDLADYLPASKRDREEMLAELRQIGASLQNPHLRALVECFLSDEELAGRYQRAPAAKYIHHAYLGGLIEHVISLCQLCRLAASHYASLDVDLLLAGAILHDVGKIYELAYERSFGYSSEGQLVGHIVIGLRLIEQKLRQLPDFPARLRSLLEHLVVSHHGTLEFGSPRVPLFPEALVLHYLDDLDAKMDCMRAIVEQDRQVEGHWTAYNTSLARVVLKKLKYLAEGDEQTAEAVPAPAPQPAAAQQREAEAMSLFGEKLSQALGDGPEDE